MSLTLTLRNRQRTRAVATHRLRRIIRCLLTDLLAIQTADLGVFIVAGDGQLNERFRDAMRPMSSPLITRRSGCPFSAGTARRDFVCLDEAVTQAPLRLVADGIGSVYCAWSVAFARLHGSGPAARRMKREEGCCAPGPELRQAGWPRTVKVRPCQRIFRRGRAYFLTGFAVLLPALITLALVKWIFISIASITDWLRSFYPGPDPRGGRAWGCIGIGPVALGLAAGLVALVGWLTRYYVGKRLVAWLDLVMLRLPLLNKIYSIIKQVNEAFSSSKKNAFKTVVLIEYPRRGIYSLGFITSDQGSEVQFHTGQPVVCIVPTTPNPTSGFLVMCSKIRSPS